MYKYEFYIFQDFICLIIIIFMVFGFRQTQPHIFNKLLPIDDNSKKKLTDNLMQQNIYDSLNTDMSNDLANRMAASCHKFISIET